ncbi:serine protease [Streptomyces sp. S1A]|uniref:S1 family peptidase n=1 Tax=Streptomyces sp. ICN903 TaxID=2964654 RepID=UPI001EDA3E74|nr:serine protease [Streptomyces sp. ICN903]MCG3043719.1 serine protease [Streptomyces sp. ICN903]
MGDRTGDGVAQGARGMPWLVRIRSQDTRAVVGSGVLLGGDTVLTCAHVLPDRTSPVLVEFPEIEGAAGSTATVADGGWFPRRGEDRADLALLRVHRPPPGGHSAPLLRAAMRDMRVEMCGYADSVRHARGAALAATVSLPFGERVQLNVAPEHLPRRGFSGGPVLDMGDPPGVLGITVTASAESGGIAPLTMAHMIPVETVLNYLPRLGRCVQGPPGVEPSVLRGGPPARLDEPDYAERLAAWLSDRGRARPPVYVTEVRPGSGRDRTLRRALTLADRELSADAPAAGSTDPGSTVPPVGSLDLAVDVRGAAPEKAAVRIAERMNLRESGPARALERLRGLRTPLTVALLGVDECADPARLLELCGEFAERGCRLLLVFHRTGTRIGRQAEEDLALRHRTGALAGRLEALDARLRDLARARVRLSGVDYPGPAVTRLHMDLAWLRHAHRTGADLDRSRLPGALEELRHRTDRAERAVEAAWEAAERGYGRRAELRGELRAYRRLAVQHGRIEDVALDREYRAAHDALHAGPFEAESAARAVTGYTAAVRRVLGWPPEAGGSEAGGAGTGGTEADGPEAGARETDAREAEGERR